MAERRHVLQVAAVTALGLGILPACGRDEGAAPAPSAPDAQQADELALIAAYDAALQDATGPQRDVLRQFRDEHVAHLTALGWRGLPSARPSQAPPTPSQLIRAERRAARDRTAAARSAQDPQSAQVLALIAASEAQHADRLASL